MANSGTINGSFNGSNAQYLTFRCEWSVTSQDLANKTSNVRLKWIVTKTTSNLYTNKSNTPWSQTCNGTTTSGSLSFNLGNVSANTDYVVRDVTVTIAHASDGTKTASISGTLDLSGTSAGTGTFSGSMALPTIATTPPTLNSFTVTDVGTVPAGISDLVGGYTKIKLTATATSVSPATVSSFAFYNGTALLGTTTVTGSGQKTATFTYPQANTAGTYSFTVVVTDSYGNVTTSNAVSATVKAYKMPSLYTQTYRAVETPPDSGTFVPDPSSTQVYYTADWTIANITGNTATCTLQLGGNTYTLLDNVGYARTGFSTSNSYNAVYTVTDSFGNTATKSDFIPSEFINFDLYPDGTEGGAAFGQRALQGVFSCNMMAEFMDIAAFNAPVVCEAGLALNNAPLGISSGGSGQNGTASQTTPSNIATAESGVTISAAEIYTWGKIATLYMGFKYNQAISADAGGNVSNMVIATLKTGYRPPTYVGFYGDGDTTSAYGFINSNGQIRLCAVQGTGASRTIAANTTLYLYATYILA